MKTREEELKEEVEAWKILQHREHQSKSQRDAKERHIYGLLQELKGIAEGKLIALAEVEKMIDEWLKNPKVGLGRKYGFITINNYDVEELKSKLKDLK